MSPATTAELLKVGVSLLAAFVALAAFAPKVVEKYEDVLNRARTAPMPKGRTRDYMLRVFYDRFQRPVQRASLAIVPFGLAYLCAGIAVAILLANVAFAHIPCNALTCQLGWMKSVASGMLLISFSYLVVVSLFLLNLFAVASVHTLEEGVRGPR